MQRPRSSDKITWGNMYHRLKSISTHSQGNVLLEHVPGTPYLVWFFRYYMSLPYVPSCAPTSPILQHSSQHFFKLVHIINHFSSSTSFIVILTDKIRHLYLIIRLRVIPVSDICRLQTSRLSLQFAYFALRLAYYMYSLWLAWIALWLACLRLCINQFQARSWSPR